MLQPLHAEPAPSPGPGYAAMYAIHALPAALLATPVLPAREPRGPAAAAGRSAPPAATEGRLGRLLESAMRVLAVVVLLCLAAAWLGPTLAGRAWPEPPSAPQPFATRLDAASTPATVVRRGESPPLPPARRPGPRP